MTNYTYSWSVPNDGYPFGSYHYETTTTGDYNRDNGIYPYWSITPPVPSYTDDEWKKTHSPYDGRPWWGIVPPPTYYDMEHTKTSTSYTLEPKNSDNVKIVYEDGDTTKIISINPQKLYKENNELKDRVKYLEKELDYWKTNYKGVTPKKYRDDLERVKILLNQIEEEMKRRA